MKFYKKAIIGVYNINKEIKDILPLMVICDNIVISYLPKKGF